MKTIFALCSSLLMIPTVFADIPYCATSKAVDPQESVVIQAVVSYFAKEMRCEVGNNCLKKLGPDVFSIAWNTACGGVYSLGDNGHGSLFECGIRNSRYCCWPKGFKTDPYIGC